MYSLGGDRAQKNDPNKKITIITRRLHLLEATVKRFRYDLENDLDHDLEDIEMQLILMT
jgi:hypothetical protein